MSAIVFDEPEVLRRRPNPQRSQAVAGPQWNRVTPQADAPQWLMPALESLSRLGGLASNWDGYGSPPARPAALQTAHWLVATLERLPLPTPQVCPVTGGGIGFSWQSDTRELEVEILPDGSAQYLAVATDPATGQEASQEEPLPLDQPEYAETLAAWLIGI